MSAVYRKTEPPRPYGNYVGDTKDNLYLLGSGYIYSTPCFVAHIDSRFFANVILALGPSKFNLTVGECNEDYQAVTVRPGISRFVNAPDVRLVSFNINPDHRLFRTFRLLPHSGTLKLDRAEFDFLNDDLDAAYEGRLSIEQAKKLHRQIFEGVAHCLPEPEPLDARVKRMLDNIETEGESSLENLADIVRLSYKRTSALFAQNFGLPLKSYLLWKKIQSYELQAGKFGRSRSITEIAHAAGFVDSAHLCRTFQKLFAAPPSFFFANPNVRVISCHRHNLMSPLTDSKGISRQSNTVRLTG